MDRMRGLVGLFVVVAVAAILAPAEGCSIHTRAPWAPKEVAPAPLELTVVYDEQITVDYRKKIGKLVEEGRYGSIGSYVTAKNFPRSADSPRGAVELRVVLVETDRSATTEEISDTMAQHGFRPGTLQELLTLGTQDPDLQRDYRIAALGSVSIPQLDGERKVVYLIGNAQWRQVEMTNVGQRWNEVRRGFGERVHFLAVADGGE